MSEINVNSQYRLADGKPLDAKQTPVATPADLNKIPRAQRYEGMTVVVLDYDGNGTNHEYWLVGGTANANWVLKRTNIDGGIF